MSLQAAHWPNVLRVGTSAPGACQAQHVLLRSTSFRPPTLRSKASHGSRRRQNSPRCVRASAGLAEKVVPEFYETEKEQSRKYRMTVFSHEDWFKHRSTSRYYRHILGMFETNAAYARWLDARTWWGGVVNRSRDVVRQGLTWLSSDKHVLVDMLQRWTIAFPRALKCHLTYDSDLAEELKHILNEREVEALIRSSHRPNYVTRMIAEIIDTAKLTDSEVFLMDTNLSFFMDAAGGCERIFKTPIPLSWTRHTSRFLMLWLAFLPCIIYSTCHWATPIVAAVISLSLLACDEISVTLEEPFGILPLDNLCEVIEADVKEMAAQKKECEALVQEQLPLLPEGNGSTKGTPAGSLPKKLTSSMQSSDL